MNQQLAPTQIPKVRASAKKDLAVTPRVADVLGYSSMTATAHEYNAPGQANNSRPSLAKEGDGPHFPL